MHLLLKSTIVVVGAVFGACVGAVLGLASCLVLRDAFQWPMPLPRIALVATLFAAAGAVVSVVIDVLRWRTSANEK